MIVADANLLLYLIMQGPRTEVARAVIDLDDAWAAPRLWRSEVLSALGGHVRRGDVGIAGAVEMFEGAEAVIGEREFDVGSADVVEASLDSGCTTYDCEYVEVARMLGVPLVTADKQVLGAFPRIAVSPERFVKGRAT